MKRLLIVLVVGILAAGCSYGRRGQIHVLRESEMYYYIPAGTPFNAVVQKGEPPIQVTRNAGTWAVDAGYLAKLQAEANAAILQPPE